MLNYLLKHVPYRYLLSLSTLLMTDQKLPLVEAAYDKSFLNFSKGIPSFSILPTEELSQASIEFAKKKDSDYLTYGHWQGNGYLRRSLAHFLTEQLQSNRE